jgi:hypothetical protein
MELSTFQWDSNGGWSNNTVLGTLDSSNTLVLVFAGAHIDGGSVPLAELIAAYPNSKIAGCSTSGEILDDALADDTLTVAVARFETTSVRLNAVPVSGPHDSFAAGAALAASLFGDQSGASQTDAMVRSIFVLSVGLGVSGSLLVDGLVSICGHSVVISGGLAGDGARFERTWVLVDGQPRTGYVVGVALCGPDLRIGDGTGGGWEIFGPERLITKSTGAVLYELDGRPALELYKDYLGARAAELPASALLFPLAVRNHGHEQVVRTVLAVDHDDQSMTFAGDIPQGSHAQLMRANTDRLIEGAYGAALSARKNDAHEQVLGVAVSCVGRRLLLGRRTEDELEAVVSALGPDVSLVGFYSYGEISPCEIDGAALHNQTMTVTTFTEQISNNGGVNRR